VQRESILGTIDPGERARKPWGAHSSLTLAHPAREVGVLKRHGVGGREGERFSCQVPGTMYGILNGTLTLLPLQRWPTTPLTPVHLPAFPLACSPALASDLEACRPQATQMLPAFPDKTLIIPGFSYSSPSPIPHQLRFSHSSDIPKPAKPFCRFRRIEIAVTGRHAVII